MATPDAVAILRSIDATLKQILQLLQQTIPKPVADESELNNPKADEEIKVEPRDWVGESYKGRHLSEAPATFLELLAKTYDYFAERNDRTNAVTEKGTPKSEFDRRTARRARGFAKRNREHPPTQRPADTWDTDADIRW